jgi:hypothetical protein
MSDGIHSFATTYSQLKARVAAILSAKGVSDQRVMNYASALNGWMRRLGLADDSLIGKEMTSDFDGEFLRHQDFLIETLAPRTARDQTEHLLTWRRHFEECRQIDMLPADFKGAFKSLFAPSEMSKAELSRQSGVCTASLHRWLDLPDLPVLASAPEVGRLEKALGVPDGALLNRLPGRRYSRYARTEKEVGSLQTPWSKKQSEERKTLGAYAAPLSGRLHTQLLDLIDFKTDHFREGGAKHNSWRQKPATKTGCRITKAMVSSSGLICPTASANWCGISSYLGFLCLKSPGKGLPAEDVSTMAWLIHFPYVIDYVRWLTVRADGKMHNGITKFLDDVKCMLRPKTGYLWSRPAIADTLPTPAMVLGHDYPQLSDEQRAICWRELCATTHRKITDRVKAIRGGGNGKVSKSRDPIAPIASILSSPSPLKILLQFVYDLESNPPPILHHRDYVVWIRDVLFLKLIVSNPLRASQFAVMRYQSNNRGNLYQAADGHWRMRFTAEDFKNEKGAAYAPYDVAVEPSVGPWIARYLAESRPYLIGASECDFLLLPCVPGPNHGKRADGDYATDKGGMWTGEGISRRMKALTRKYVADTPGFGTQAIRHIIATDHLIRHPGDYLAVAKLLHDKLETVLNEYGHLSTDHTLKGLHRDIHIFNKELSGAAVR